VFVVVVSVVVVVVVVFLLRESPKPFNVFYTVIGSTFKIVLPVFVSRNELK